MCDSRRLIYRKAGLSEVEVDLVESYLDRDNDGRVTLSDIEQLVIRFLVGEDYGKYMIK